MMRPQLLQSYSWRSLLTLNWICVVALFLPLFAPTLGAAVVYGVPPNDQPRYAAFQSSNVFACLDGSKTVPLNQVNDDYCDCGDGSDEPGTAACSNGAGFWCINEGYIGQRLVPSRVRDGVCDCCDGSDEFDFVTNKPVTACVNTCKQIADELAKKEAERKARIQQAASARQEAAAKGREAKAARQAKLAQLPQDIAALQAEIDILSSETAKQEEIEKQERAQKLIDAEIAFTKALALSSFADKELQQVLMDLAFRKNEMSTEKLIDLVKSIAGPTHTIDETALLFDSLPKTEQSETQKAVEVAKAELKTAQEAKEPPSTPEVLTALEAKVKAAEEAESAAQEQLKKQKQEALLVGINANALSLAQLANMTQTLAKTTNQSRVLVELVAAKRGQPLDSLVAVPPEETPAHTRPEAEDLRKRTEAKKGDKTRVESTLREVQTEEAMDFGPDLEYWVMKGQCYTITKGETYKLCPFETSYQGSRSIGRWQGWHKQSEWHSKYRMMKFTNGDKYPCPSERTLDVNVECGTTYEILKVEEPAICKYAMTFTCPQACTEDTA